MAKARGNENSGRSVAREEQNISQTIQPTTALNNQQYNLKPSI